MNISSGKMITAQKVVIYGPEGIGKSTLAAAFPDPLFIDTEGSTRLMDVRRFDQPTSWQMLLDEIDYVKAHPSECKTLVIDTADWAEKLCVKAVLDKNSKSGIEEFGYGKGFTYVYEAFGAMLNKLDDVIAKGIHVVLTAHARLTKFEQPDEMGAYDRWGMKLQDSPKASIASMIKEWADMVLFCTYKTLVVKEGSEKNAKNKAVGGQRVMYTSHHPCWDAKNRHGLPDELPMEFAKIAHCFPSMGATAEIAPPVKPDEPAKQPEAKPAPRPIQGAEQIPIIPGAGPNIPADLPKALRDLMTANDIDEAEIRRVVASKGYYPENTPIQKYDSKFVNGALIAGWNKLLEMIRDTGDLSFTR